MIAADVGLLSVIGLAEIRSASAVAAIISICFSLASLLSAMMLSFSMGSDMAAEEVEEGVSHRVLFSGTHVLILA